MSVIGMAGNIKIKICKKIVDISNYDEILGFIVHVILIIKNYIYFYFYLTIKHFLIKKFINFNKA